MDAYSDERGGANGCTLHPHSALRSVEAHLVEKGESLDGFFIFTLCRNPWDRAVSLYHYGLSDPKSARHAPAVEAGAFKPVLWSEMIERHFRPQPHQMKLAQGPYDVPTFGADLWGVTRAEVFDISELHRLKAKLDAIGASPRIPRVNTTRHRRYIDYYDDEARERVAWLFEKDIAFMAYHFEGGEPSIPPDVRSPISPTTP